MSFNFILSRPWVVVHDDPPAPPPAPPSPTDPPATFTQDQVNKFLAEERRKSAEKTKKALEELDLVKSKATLTDQERKDMESRIESLSNELLTKEELAKKEKETIAKKLETEKQQAIQERDGWQRRFIDSNISTALTQAAVEGKAYNPEQIIALLKPNTRMVEELGEDGKPTGNLIPKVKLTDMGKDGKQVTLELHPKDAVKRLRESDAFINLFNDDSNGGLGRFSKAAGGQLDIQELAKDPAAYRKARAEGKVDF
jgi:hypothetical protein